jgi:hypothetical protein
MVTIAPVGREPPRDESLIACYGQSQRKFLLRGVTDPKFEDALLGLELLLPLLLLEPVLLEPFPVATEETCVVLVPVACGFYSPISGSRKHI